MINVFLENIASKSLKSARRFTRQIQKQSEVNMKKRVKIMRRNSLVTASKPFAPCQSPFLCI